MDLELIRKDKNVLEFKIKGERHSIPNLLKSKLAEDKSIEFVAYKLEHPTENDALFIVKTKEEKPEKVIKKACSELIDEINLFQQELKKLKWFFASKKAC